MTAVRMTVSIRVAPKRAPQPAASPGTASDRVAAYSGGAGGGQFGSDTRAKLHGIRSADPEQVERTGEDLLRGQAQTEPERLVLGADDLALLVEAREVARQLERVRGDPVRRALVGRLPHLGTERDEPLDQ